MTPVCSPSTTSTGRLRGRKIPRPVAPGWRNREIARGLRRRAIGGAYAGRPSPIGAGASITIRWKSSS